MRSAFGCALRLCRLSDRWLISHVCYVSLGRVLTYSDNRRTWLDPLNDELNGVRVDPLYTSEATYAQSRFFQLLSKSTIEEVVGCSSEQVRT